MNEWHKLTLGELIEKGQADLQTGPFGTMLNSSEYVPSGIPVIAVQDIGNNRLIHDRFVFVNEATAKRLERYKVKNGDIIFGRKGAVDRRAIVNKFEEGWLQGSDCIRLRLNDAVDSRFVSYQFGSDFHKEWMFQHAGGATMPSLNQQILKLLPITLPPLSEQRAITTVLASLDDKIDLLQRQNKTLEGLAQTLFRHWFVDGAEDDWKEGVIGDLFLLKRGFDLPEQRRQSGKVPIISASGINGYHNEARVVGSGITTGRSGLLGKVFYIQEDFWPLNTSLFVENDKTGTPLFVYFLLKSIDLESLNAGSAVPTLNRNDVHALETLIPPAKLIKRFGEITEPLFEKLKKNNVQIQTLERLRNTLLPKLMSGEVRVHL